MAYAPEPLLLRGQVAEQTPSLPSMPGAPASDRAYRFGDLGGHGLVSTELCLTPSGRLASRVKHARRNIGAGAVLPFHSHLGRAHHAGNS